MNFSNHFEEPGESSETRPTPRGRKRNTSGKPNKKRTKKINISNNDPTYCRQPITFGGKTLFTQHEVSNTSSSHRSDTSSGPSISVTTMTRRLTTSDTWQTFTHVPDVVKNLRKDVFCWYCCSPFDTCPVSLPIAKKKNGKFLCHGVFCSWECCKSYNLCTSNTLKHVRGDYLNELVRKAYKKFSVHINCAPYRYHLKQFGGTLDIEMFRQGMLHMSEEQKAIVYAEMDFTTKTPCNEIL